MSAIAERRVNSSQALADKLQAWRCLSCVGGAEKSLKTKKQRRKEQADKKLKKAVAAARKEENSAQKGATFFTEGTR